MSKTRHVIFTVLILGNIPVMLQAHSAAPRIESVAAEKRSAATRVRELLEAQGMESDAAQRKAEGLFVRPMTVQALQTLSTRLGGTPGVAQIESALARRALFDKQFDRSSVDQLIGLYQSASGKVPDADALEVLHAVAAQA